MSIIIGLTGPTGSGKSTAARAIENLGFTIVDCDKLARVAVEKGSNGLADLVKAFGAEILNDDKSLNRKALAGIAFATKQNTEKLNQTLLPHIALLVEKECAKAKKILLDAPTLFESGINKICTATVAVLAEKQLRLERIIKRDNIDTESALLRINAGKTDDFYKQNSDYIIYNNGQDEIFLNEIKKIINSITGKN